MCICKQLSDLWSLAMQVYFEKKRTPFWSIFQLLKLKVLFVKELLSVKQTFPGDESLFHLWEQQLIEENFL